MSDVQITGLPELQRFLDQLPAKLEANIVRSALRQGANVLRDEAKQNVPVQSGALRNSLKVSTRLRQGVASASVRTKVFYARWIEYGTKAHAIAAKDGALSFGGLFAKSVHHPGVHARPFLRPALDARAQDAVIAVAEQIKKRLTKEGLNASHVMVEGDE